MFALATILGFLKYIPAATAAIPQVKEFIDTAIGTLKGEDQAVAKAAYADLMQDNDEGYKRLDEKLAAAEQRR